MSGPELSDERRVLVEALREFTQSECGTREQRDRLRQSGTETYSPELSAKLAELGWLGVSVPEEFGGAGGSVVDACLLLEGLEYGRAPAAAIAVTLIVGAAIEKFGSYEQKGSVLASICEGTPKAIAMSEPDSGSDVGSLRTRARRTADGWVVDGQKTWITAADHADQILVICRTDPDAPKHDGLSMLLVRADAPGVEVRPIETMGGRDVSEVFLSNVELSDDALVGEENEGWRQLMVGLNFERLISAAWMLGTARRAFDDTLEYVTERRQFDSPIGSFQVLKHRLADLATEIECARLLVYSTAHRVERNPEKQLPREASMAKLKASEIAKRMALEGMQMMGGAGYSSDYDMERLVRKALPMTIYAGTSEIQREIIARTYGL